MNPRVEFPSSASQLLKILAATGRAVKETGLTSGLSELAPQWARHVEETEERIFPHLVANGPAADGPVGFCLAEHAALSVRLASLAATQPTFEWLREAEALIGSLIHHMYAEARILRPLLEQAGCEWCMSGRIEGRDEN